MGKFDEFSKHMAEKHSRRGAFKLLGASILGAATASFASKTASAGPAYPQFNYTLPNFNHTLPNFNHTLPSFNQTIPQFNQVQQVIQEVEKKLGFKLPFFWWGK